MRANDSSMGAVIKALQDGRSFVLPLHLVPDGDSVGSCLALAEALRWMGRKAAVISHDPVPVLLNFIPGAEAIMPLASWDGTGETLVILDASDPGRAGLTPEMWKGRVLVNIDHHLSNDGFGDASYVDREASSCAEMVYRLLTAMDVPISSSMATQLYVGIMTDTGSFRFDNTSAECLAVASELVRLGAMPSQLARKVYETKTLSSLRLTGEALVRLTVSDCGRVAWTVVTRQMLLHTGASDDEAEGIVNYARMIPEVEVGIVFKEMQDGTTRVGLRSKEWVDVSRIAALYGGGGHARASGFTYNGSIEEAVQEVVERVCAVVRGKP